MTMFINTNPNCLKDIFQLIESLSVFSKDKIQRDFALALAEFFKEYDMHPYEPFAYGNEYFDAEAISKIFVFGLQREREYYGNTYSLCMESTFPKSLDFNKVIQQLLIEVMYIHYPIHNLMMSYNRKFSDLTPEQIAQKYSYEHFFPETA